MDRHYTSVDQAQWAREGVMENERISLAEMSRGFRQKEKFLRQLCAVATDEQINMIDGLAAFLQQERERAEKQQRTKRFMDEEMDGLLLVEFNKLRQQAP